MTLTARNFTWRGTGEATCFCTLNAAALTDPHHVREFRAGGLRWVEDRALPDGADAHAGAAAAALPAGDPTAAASACAAALAIHPHHEPALRRMDALRRG